jgi:uncharacterized protein DUF3147
MRVRIEIDTSGMRQSRWYEYVIRFVFGGSITVLAGLVAKHWGPEIGGLFLAFPAIFPATATLIQKHEKQKKERFGFGGTKRGREAAGIDAAGATIGCIGLMAFAAVIWRGLPSHPLSIVLATATSVWLLVSVLGWELWQVRRRHSRAKRSRRYGLGRSANKSARMENEK